MCIAISLRSHWAASLGRASQQKVKLASAKVPSPVLPGGENQFLKGMGQYFTIRDILCTQGRVLFLLLLALKTVWILLMV